MTIKQISVFIENKHGRLAEITKLLSDSKIDIRALSVADTKDFGILRLIVDDPEKAEAILRESGCVVSITYVIAVAMDDEPGSLLNIVSLLSNKDIGIEYMYAFIGRHKDEAYVILRVEDNEKAIEVLKADGKRLANAKDIYSIVD